MTFIQGALLTAFVFIVVPLWAYVMTKMISMAWVRGKIAGLNQLTKKEK